MKKILLICLMNILDFILHDKEYKANFNYLSFLILALIFLQVSSMSYTSTDYKFIS